MQPTARRFARACALLASYVLLIGGEARWSAAPAHLDNGLLLMIVSVCLALPSLASLLARPREVSRQTIGHVLAGTARGAALGAVYAALILGVGRLVVRDDRLAIGGLLADTAGTAAVFAAVIHALAFKKRRPQSAAPVA
jgi:hypothetical protein